MSRERKFGDVRVPGVPDDEPVFVLRAQDPLAARAVMHYRDLCFAVGCDDEHTEAIWAAAAEISQWQAENPWRVKDRPGPSGRLPGGGAAPEREAAS